MLGNDSLPRRPRSSRALDDFLNTNDGAGILESGPALGDKKRMENNHSSAVVVGSNAGGGGSALGSRSGAGGRSPPDQPKSSSSYSRRKSQSPSRGIGRRKVSKSPSNASNDSSRGASSPSQQQQQQQHPMRSPRSSKYRRSPPLQRSPGYNMKSPKKNSPSKGGGGGGKSPGRIKGDGGRGGLSSDARKRLDSSFPDLGGISSSNNSSNNDDYNQKPSTNLMQQQRSEDEDEEESLPGLIEDSIVREDVKGNRGGKQWNILEDTPGGHAPEKLVIVSGIEDLYLEEDDIIDDDDEYLPEDEDIVDDSLQIGDDTNSTTSRSSDNNNKNRNQSLPNDIPTSMAAAASAANNNTNATGNKRRSFGVNDGTDASSQIRKSTSADIVRDRFDPAFKNSEMWATDDEHETKIVSQSLRSGSVSMLSDNLGGDVDSVSELGFHSSGFFDDHDDVSQSQQQQQLQRLDYHHNMQGDGDSKNSSTIDISRTPATAKMSGGRHYNVAKMETAPNLSSSLRSSANKQYTDYEVELDNSFNHRAAVPEDAPISTSKRKSSSRRKKKSSPTNNTASEAAAAASKQQYGLKDGNNSSGRSSSNRRSVHTNTKSGSRKSRTAAGMEINPNAMRGSKRGAGQQRSRVPDVVPSTPVREIHSWKRCSPMSSSLTSTPSSLVSSMQHHQQNLALQHLRNHKHRRKNKPLQLHVGREHSPSDRRDTEDDYTLGASTITTNFSTTNRTRGDNTVSTRSLFRSEQMNHSETLKIPQRKRDADVESDYETSDPHDDQSASIIDEVEELHDSAKIEGKVAEDLDGSERNLSEILDGTIQPPEGTFKTMLRRPSGDGDDLLNSFDLISDDEKDSDDDDDGAAGSNDDGSNASDFVRWQKENANLISPAFASDGENCLEKKIANGFLELSIGNTGLHVEKTKIAEVAQISSSSSSGGTDKDTSTQRSATTTNKVQTSSSSSSGGAIKPRPRMIKHLSLAKLDENGVAHFKVPGIPPMRQKNGEVMRAPDSPVENLGKKKKSRGGRLGLFKRVQSWKGVVALKDDDED